MARRGTAAGGIATPKGEAIAELMLEVAQFFFRIRAVGQKTGFITSWGGGAFGFMRSLALLGPLTVPRIAQMRPTSRQRMQRLADELATEGLVGRIWAICGTVSGPSSARLRMKPNAPPPQLVMSPDFWPSARILKKHWATSSISSAIASALASTIRPALVLCRADTISIRFGDRASFLLDTTVVNSQNDTLVVVVGATSTASPQDL